MPYRDLSDGQILAAAGGFATICGWLSYLLKVQEGKAFNVGVSYVVHQCPRLMRALNAGDCEACANEFLDIVKANGVTLPGLVKRRREEAKLFLSEV